MMKRNLKERFDYIYCKIYFFIDLNPKFIFCKALVLLHDRHSKKLILDAESFFITVSKLLQTEHCT